MQSTIDVDADIIHIADGGWYDGQLAAVPSVCYVEVLLGKCGGSTI